MSELTEEQAAAVIRRLNSLKPENESMTAADGEVKAFISEAQIKKIFGLMYELAVLSPSEVKVENRLCGIIQKEFGIRVDPRTDIFKGFSERH